MSHVIYEDGDTGIPPTICDANGQVVLALCKVCGQAEADLAPACPGAEFVAGILVLASAGLCCFKFDNTREYLKDIVELCGEKRP